MKKKELLQSIGFSKEFIEYYEKVENEDMYVFQNDSFSNEISQFAVSDTSELYMERQLKKDYNTLKYKYK